MALAAACCSKPEKFSVIPQPNDVTFGKGSFCVKGAEVEIDPSIDKESRKAIGRFIEALETATGKKTKAGDDGFEFKFNPNLAAEQYFIDIDDDEVKVEASALNGFIYACETLKHMLPAAIYGNKKAKGNWVLPCVRILDEPRFGYRGMHLDCSRHFWTVEETKKYIDIMVAYKLNTLHWHLTDDQGWRIEIKSYPLLSQISCWREGTMIGQDFSSNDGIRYGGFYTQEQIRDVVAYAAARGIEVMPEIELPGHMLAAMAAYPELGCTGGPYAAWTKWGVSDEVLCVGKESTFTFLEAVLGEVAELFPGEYIHIGGDECPKTQWEKCPLCQARIRELGLHGDGRFTAEQYLQNYVTKRVQDFLATKGKKIVGWDEILEGELAPGATVMSWRGTAGAKEAAAKGFDAILAPTSHCYFDYLQSEDKASEPLGFNGVVTLEKIYSLDPLEGIPAEQVGHILGLQANLWTEYISTPEHLEYMLLPRMLALSEVQWCRPEHRDPARFLQALREHEFPVLDLLGYHYRKTLNH